MTTDLAGLALRGGAWAGSAPVDAADRLPSHIAACEAPHYHVSQTIQAHGLFLALERGSLRVARASANAGPAV
jgi:light-regulated signal transduction histidine kinase (bacteriophytochrome)